MGALSRPWNLARMLAFAFALAGLAFLAVTLVGLEPGRAQTWLVIAQAVLVLALFLLGLLGDGARRRAVPDLRR